MERDPKEIRFVVDTNVLISALLKDDSITSRLLRSNACSYYYPWDGLTEINYYKEYDRIWRNVDQKLSLSHLKEIQPIINEEFLDHLPPPTFDISFMTKDNVDILKSISSGERQMIYTLTSIIYHIVNINSVNSFELIKKGL